MFDAQSQVSGATTMVNSKKQILSSNFNNHFLITLSVLRQGPNYLQVKRRKLSCATVRLDIGQWMVNTSEIYYMPGSLSVESSLKAYLRNTKTITKNNRILKNRGVSHEADLLQVEGAVIAADALREDENQLNNDCQLIIYLKLDPAFLRIDPCNTNCPG